jgi:hypothetical protein
MTQRTKKPGWIQRFVRWLFGSPFRELPPEFGDPVPSELRVFEAQAEEAQHQAQGDMPPLSSVHPGQTKPVRQDEFLERE